MSQAYRQAGVDVVKADHWLSVIGKKAKTTHDARVRAAVGGYASLYKVNSDLWIAASTDGVGTKIKLAVELGCHDTLGQDLVAMSVNDVLCVGAEPWFFLDYFATAKLDPAVATPILQGIIKACKLAGIALVGGETAEMPGIYQLGDYDLAGFCIGGVHPKKVLPRSRKVKPGAVVIGVASSGFHSNGYSLLRHFQTTKSVSRSELKAWLTPTRIYTKCVKNLLKSKQAEKVLGLAHITGSGFLNLPRVSDRVSYELTLPPEKERAKVYHGFADWCGLPLSERAVTWNLGVGLCVVVEKDAVAGTLANLKRSGERAWILGRTVKRQTKDGCTVEISDPSTGESCRLVY